MKIINSFKYIMLSIVLLTTSCQDFTEIEPKGVLAANLALQNLNDYNLSLLGAYDVMQGGGYLGSAYSLLPDILTENLKRTSENLNSFVNHRDWDYSPSDDLGMWATLYAMLNRLNIVINGVGEFEDEDPQFHNRILAQALALRAMVHFDLLRYYGGSYRRDDTTPQGGIVIVTSVLPASAQPPRNTVAETYDQIYSDLEVAELLYADIDERINASSSNENHFMDLTAMKALRARISLYAQDWGDAINQASDVIDIVPLANTTDFAEMWTNDEAGGENIMSVPYNSAEGGFAVTGTLWNPTDPSQPLAGGTSQFTLTDELVGFYTSSDVRFTTWVADAPAGKSYNRIQRKYPNDGANIFSDFKIFRTGEMYLILAEAYFRQGNAAQAANFLTQLIQNRDPSASPVSDNLDLRIEVERRKELMLEGHRWFDIRRYREITGANESDNVNRVSTEYPTGSKLSVPSPEQRFIFPIPQSETFANPNIQQIGGW